MRKRNLFSAWILGAAWIGAASSASAASCSDPKSMEDPRIVIEPCSAIIANETMAVDDRVRALEYRARAYRFSREYSAALADINAGLSLKPEDSALYSVRSMIHEKMDNPNAAWVDAVEAINRNPDAPLYYERIANLCINFGLLAQAKEFIEYSGKSFPNDTGLKYIEAWYFRSMNDYHQMADVLIDVLRTSSVSDREAQLLTWRGRLMRGDVPTLIFLSEALTNDYRWDEALKAAERAVEISSNGATLLARALVYQSWPYGNQMPSRSPSALADVDAAIKLDPDFAEAHAIRGRILLSMHRYEDALISTNEALRLDPKADSQVWQRFLINRALGRASDAERDIVKYASSSWNIPVVIRKLRPLGYWLEAEAPLTITPVFLAGLRACALDDSCW